LQTQSSFASTDFNGNYVVNSSANTVAGVSYSLIQFNASGGNISTGYYDVNNTGNVGSTSLTGAYSVNSNGRVLRFVHRKSADAAFCHVYDFAEPGVLPG
jgi:hypothetical protein